MAINVQTTSQAVNANFLQSVMSNRQLVAALARQIVAGQVEAYMEMMEDYPAEHPNFAAVRGCLQSAKEGTVDFLPDLLEEFRENLYAAIEDVQIEVTNATFNAAGFVDATAEITSKA